MHVDTVLRGPLLVLSSCPSPICLIAALLQSWATSLRPTALGEHTRDTRVPEAPSSSCALAKHLCAALAQRRAQPASHHPPRCSFVKRAMHGTRMMSPAEVREQYGRELVNLRNESRFIFLNTLFSISEAVLYMQVGSAGRAARTLAAPVTCPGLGKPSCPWGVKARLSWQNRTPCCSCGPVFAACTPCWLPCA